MFAPSTIHLGLNFFLAAYTMPPYICDYQPYCFNLMGKKGEKKLQNVKKITKREKDEKKGEV
jgi:hypothetical protein